MRTFLAVLFILSVTVVARSDEGALLARFESYSDTPDIIQSGPDAGKIAKIQPRYVTILRTVGSQITVERINGSDVRSYYLGEPKTTLLLERIRSVHLPQIDYQAYFKKLAKEPPTPRKLRVIALNGPETEVEFVVNGTHVEFRMLAPIDLFYAHSNDEIAANVKEVIDAFIVALEGRSLGF